MSLMHVMLKGVSCAAGVLAVERCALASDVTALRWPGGASCDCLAGDLNGDCAIDGADLGVLLGAWGSAGASGDITGDGAVDGADLGAMLSNWGPCPAASSCGGYGSIELAGEFVGGPGEFIPVVVLAGTVDVFDSGEPQGSVSAIFGDGSSVAVDIALAYTTVYVDESVVALPSSGPPWFASIDGAPVSISAMLGQFDQDLRFGESPMNWSAGSRAVLVLTALGETQAFCCDLETALQDATSASSAFWCKVGLVSLGGCLMAESVAGCVVMTDGCDTEPSQLVGAFPMPCELLEGLCVDGEFAGPQATFDSVLGMWLGQ